MEQSSSVLNPNVYTLDSPHPVYAMAFSSSASAPFRLALGSFLEEYNNRVDIVTFDVESTAFRPESALSFEHPYPATKLMFHPRPIPGSTSSLIASSGDFLRLWQVHHDEDGSGKSELRSMLNNSKASDFCAPLTSFDWNDAEPRRIGTSSIDTTCTVWDIERGAVETQLIAHDKEVRMESLNILVPPRDSDCMYNGYSNLLV